MNNINNTLVWLVLVTLIASVGYLYTRVQKNETGILAVAYLVTTTNDNARNFMEELAEASQIKDPTAEALITRRVVNKYDTMNTFSGAEARGNR